jgi:hypothetical protein
MAMFNCELAISLATLNPSSNELIDFNWNFGVTASTDECEHVGQTYLHLKILIKTVQGHYKNILVELTVDQFYQFLAQMESCKSYLDLLSPPPSS